MSSELHTLLYWNPTTKLRYCHPDFTDKLTFREIKSLRLCSWPPGCTAVAGNDWCVACVRAQSHSEAERYTQACHWKTLMNGCWFEDFSLDFGHVGKHHMVTTFQGTIFSSMLFNWMSNVIWFFFFERCYSKIGLRSVGLNQMDLSSVYKNSALKHANILYPFPHFIPYSLSKDT